MKRDEIPVEDALPELDLESDSPATNSLGNELEDLIQRFSKDEEELEPESFELLDACREPEKVRRLQYRSASCFQKVVWKLWNDLAELEDRGPEVLGLSDEKMGSIYAALRKITIGEIPAHLSLVRGSPFFAPHG